jgi:hypothetical protein
MLLSGGAFIGLKNCYEKFDRRAKMEMTEQFETEIKPFYWVKLSTGASVCLTVGEEYLQDIFDARAEDGFIGNGYDWASLAHKFLNEKYPELQEKIDFDPEAGMFCAYSEDKEALADFIHLFKNACEDKAFISDIFRRVEWDEY